MFYIWVTVFSGGMGQIVCASKHLAFFFLLFLHPKIRYRYLSWWHSSLLYKTNWYVGFKMYLMFLTFTNYRLNELERKLMINAIPQIQDLKMDQVQYTLSRAIVALNDCKFLWYCSFVQVCTWGVILFKISKNIDFYIFCVIVFDWIYFEKDIRYIYNNRKHQRLNHYERI